MPVVTPPPLTDVPDFPALSDRAAGTYNSKAFAFGTHMADVFNGEMAALATNVRDNAADAEASANLAAASKTAADASRDFAAASAVDAAASAGASIWVSGTTYAIGAVRYSPVTQRIYRRLTAGAGTTDPSADGANWALVSNDPLVLVVSTTTQAALANTHYVLTNVAATTVTLPASPASGATVWVTWANNLVTNVIARNGQTIMGLAEDMTLDAAPNSTVQLRFVNASWRLV